MVEMVKIELRDIYSYARRLTEDECMELEIKVFKMSYPDRNIIDIYKMGYTRLFYKIRDLVVSNQGSSIMIDNDEDFEYRNILTDNGFRVYFCSRHLSIDNLKLVNFTSSLVPINTIIYLISNWDEHEKIIFGVPIDMTNATLLLPIVNDNCCRLIINRLNLTKIGDILRLVPFIRDIKLLLDYTDLRQVITIGDINYIRQYHPSIINHVNNMKFEHNTISQEYLEDTDVYEYNSVLEYYRKDQLDYIAEYLNRKNKHIFYDVGNDSSADAVIKLNSSIVTVVLQWQNIYANIVDYGTVYPKIKYDNFHDLDKIRILKKMGYTITLNNSLSWHYQYYIDKNILDLINELELDHVPHYKEII